MKQMKRWCSMLLVLCLCMSMIPVRVNAKTTITSPTGAKGSDYSAAYASKLDDIFQGRVPLFTSTSATFPLGQSINNNEWYTVGGALKGKQCYIYSQAVYYYLFGDIVYHGNGLSSAYWKNSKQIMSNSTSASYSSFRDAGVGFGAYIRTTPNSDGSFNAGAGHSMIVMSYDSTGITYLAGNTNGSGLVRITTETWSEFNTSQLTNKGRRIGHIVQCNSADQGVTKVTLSLDKTQSKVGEAITFTSAADSICSYELTIKNLDSGTYLVQNEAVSATCKKTLNVPGHYVAQVKAIHAKGSVESNAVEFWVFGAAPNTASVSASKTTLALGDTVTLTASSDADYALFSMDILLYNNKYNGTKVFSGEISGSVSFKPTENGVYKARVTARTHEASVNSDYVTFYVGKYTVKYDANGGSGAPSSQTKYYGKDLALSTAKPSRTNYTFQGWAASSGASKAEYQPGAVYAKNANLTLYAVWKHVCAAGHSYTYQVTKAPTDAATGKLTGTCTRCSGTTSVTLPQLTSEEYSYAAVQAATCTTPGIGRYTWDNTTYGTFYFDAEIPVMGHSISAVVTAPTCTEQGYTTYTDCCGNSYVDRYTEALGHDFENGICIRCGRHSFGFDSAVSGEADGLTWTIDEEGVLTISGEMTDYTEEAEMPWFEYLDVVTSVVIEEGVTTIGDYAFCGMTSLVTVEIPSTVTRIGDYAFYGCTELAEVTIPAGVTELGELCFSENTVTWIAE